MQRNALAAALLCALALTACRSTESRQEATAAADEEIDRVEVTGSRVAQNAAKDERGAAKPVSTIAPQQVLEAKRDGRADKSSREQAKSVGGQRIRREATASQTSGYLAPAPPPPQTRPLATSPSVNYIAAAPAEPEINTEKYAEREDNPIQRASEQPVSTFSIDVDTGSYSNVRRMLRDGVRPPADAVRAEEMINYFDYGHAGPTSLATPFKATTELAPAPWNGKRQLLMIGIKGYDVPKAELPPSNLVFLIDTSGSMDQPNKLPLLKQSFAQLVEQLRPQDRVSVVVYAGSAGLVLEPTSGAEKETILAALNNLSAGGSTNGGQGIQLAYAMAKQAFIKNGVNRVILATDGDFNVGVTDPKALETLVGDQRQHGIALTTLGFGQGNYNDAMAERLADVGDGNHAYIDTLQEARKVLVQEMQSTLLTIAKDVKIQIEFNPALVAEYRLIGYENRMLRREDFNNDKVDAGDIGAGHEVTALYELTLVGSGAERLPALRYAAPTLSGGPVSNELANLKLRYKRPGENTSRLIETPIVKPHEPRRYAPSASMRFAATVAAYADALRGGKHLEQWQWQDIARSARQTIGRDPWGERAEFVSLVENAQRMIAGDKPSDPPQIGMIAD
jgi:Ca-activated chloride channel family protein